MARGKPNRHLTPIHCRPMGYFATCSKPKVEDKNINTCLNCPESTCIAKSSGVCKWIKKD